MTTTTSTTTEPSETITTTITTTELSETTTTTKILNNIVSDEELCEWAVNDYQEKNGITAENTKLTVNSDGMYEIELSDESGNALDTYIIDPITGIGTDSSNEEVNLPQTGNNSKHHIFVIFSAIMFIGIGLWMIQFSNFICIKRDEK